MKALKSLLCVAVLSLAATTGAFAQGASDYPNKPVRVIVPWAPGGPADIIARIIAQKLSDALGKQCYVENHAGAGGNLGAQHVAGRDLHDAVAVLQALRLGTLARARRAEKNEAH